MNTEESDPTLRVEEIAMAKMIRAKALEMGNQKLARCPCRSSSKSIALYCAALEWCVKHKKSPRED
jgi:hypothetical protein